MIYRVEVSTKPGLPDARGESLRRNIAGIQSLAVTDLTFLKGDLDDGDVSRLAGTLLHDPVVEQARWFALDADAAIPGQPAGGWSVEVTLHPGVTDSVAESLLAGAALIGVDGLEQVATGQRYDLAGDLTDAAVRRIAASLLANEVIQTWTINGRALPPFVAQAELAASVWVETIPLTAASPDQLLAISQERRLSLDLAEMQAIQGYYRQESREPTDVELETLAQTWSEHCVHKTFRALIDYREIDADGERRASSRSTRSSRPTSARPPSAPTSRGCARPSSTTPASSPSTTTTTWPSRSRPTTTPRRWSRSAAPTPASAAWCAT